MLDVIGKELSIAEKLLSEENYSIVVQDYISDKQKEWDTMIVVRQRIINNTIELVVSNFKLEI